MIPTIFLNYGFCKNIYRLEPKIEPPNLFVSLRTDAINPQIKELKSKKQKRRQQNKKEK